MEFNECEVILSLAEKHRKSWTYWVDIELPSTQSATRTLRASPESLISTPGFVKTFARVYARAVAGHLVESSYDPSSRHFKATITLDLRIRAATEIQVPTDVFADETSFAVKVEPRGSMQWFYSAGVLYIERCQHGMSTQFQFTIVIHAL